MDSDHLCAGWGDWLVINKAVWGIPLPANHGVKAKERWWMALRLDSLSFWICPWHTADCTFQFFIFHVIGDLRAWKHLSVRLFPKEAFLIIPWGGICLLQKKLTLGIPCRYTYFGLYFYVSWGWFVGILLLALPQPHQCLTNHATNGRIMLFKKRQHFF